MKVKVGQTIYYSRYIKGEGYSDLNPIEVTKIGTKFIQTKMNGQKVFYQDSSNADTRGWIDNIHQNNHNRYFQSVEHANEFFEGRKLRRKILDLERTGKLDDLTIEQLRKICEVF
jgi:hypothetical protein